MLGTPQAWVSLVARVRSNGYRYRPTEAARAARKEMLVAVGNSPFVATSAEVQIPRWKIREMSASADPEARVLAARNSRCQSEVLRVLAADPVTAVREAVAGSPNLRSDTWSLLARDPEKPVRVAAGANRSVSVAARVVVTGGYTQGRRQVKLKAAGRGAARGVRGRCR